MTALKLIGEVFGACIAIMFGLLALGAVCGIWLGREVPSPRNKK